ncbi:HAMP domain-containing histidine kinase [Jatrophihabitans telluris]|uniref:histidine kinase n=1 Tax=Jatrophihabitans telluris TaxID=2038343 RepID=A0ABY4QVR1_9ACTN|nr:HAMP domain-containing sensor histidine kinase [Jatrophihabitans telluris]UQX87374.1 HAMP domain-containing histidine kinase [Jatrophihabitans telluris]
MSAIDSSPAKHLLAAGWVVFSSLMAALMYLLPGEETIPYHLIWASFALLYGLYRWSTGLTWLVFSIITLVTGIALVRHARSGVIGWEECTEIVLMGVLVALLIWHVKRFQAAQDRLNELRESERTKAEHRDVAARFGSHEVRTRLTIARGFAELIRDKTTDETTRADAAVVVSELDKATAMTTKLLTLVRAEAPSERLPIDVVTLIETISRRWAATVDRDWKTDVHLGRMLADSERLEAALDCLVENAVKFTEPGDSILLSVTADGEDVLIAVEDSGLGIPRADLNRVTEIFQTGSAAGSRGGSGLGLSIVRTMVESRGGQLELSSTEGNGTRVAMRIPGAHAERRTAVPLPLNVRVPASG